MTTVKMLGIPSQGYVARGASYKAADVSGVITGVALGDVVDLLNAGCSLSADNFPAPSGSGVLFGGSASGSPNASMFMDGQIFRLAGAPIASNAADTTDDILAGFVLPAGALDVANRGILLNFQGRFAANGNNKTIKVWANPTTMTGSTTTNGVISGGVAAGGTPLFTTGVITSNALGWEVSCLLSKYGAAGSNTQMLQSTNILGTVHGGISLPTAITLAENAAINIVVTGASGTTGAAADVACWLAQALGMN